MNTLNFKHLRYFWMVGKTGSIAKASEQLNLSPQSISGQLGDLENSLGVQLFRKAGRGLELTEIGRKVFSYADEIFSLGNELLEVTQFQEVRKSIPFRIGITDSVPKSVAYRVIEPVIHIGEKIRLICREGKLDDLLSQMSVNKLDLVIADRPMPPNINVRAYNHLIGESKLAIFGANRLVENQKEKSFPKILHNAPFLLPGEDFAFQKKLTTWMESKKIYPHILGEFDDSALLKAFGQAGVGFFTGPDAISDYICRQYRVEKIGILDNISEQLYAITTERRLAHPAVISIVKATEKVFLNKIN